MQNKNNKNEIFEKLTNKIENLDINDKEKKDIIKLIDGLKINNNKKNKKERDPNMPKKPKNAFMLFMDDVRKIKDNKKHSSQCPSNWIDDIKVIIKDNENKPITELSKACGSFWKDAKDKDKYENTYKRSHDKYKKDMEKYKKEHPN